MRGRVASLLEVGTGFHPELTGRENIFLNGAILGMSKAEIKRKFDEIVAFAEVEQFLDTPVKRYSVRHVCAAGLRGRRASGAGDPDRG
jgi:lipopolysaccharide transport system ATP-binding protein